MIRPGVVVVVGVGVGFGGIVGVDVVVLAVLAAAAATGEEVVADWHRDAASVGGAGGVRWTAGRKEGRAWRAGAEPHLI